MRITSNQLRVIINEELQKTLLSELGEARNPYPWEKHISRDGSAKYTFETVSKREYVVTFSPLNEYLKLNNEEEHVKLLLYSLAFGYDKKKVQKAKGGRGFQMVSKGTDYSTDTAGSDLRIMQTIIASIRDFIDSPEVVKNPINGKPILLAYSASSGVSKKSKDQNRRANLYPRIIKRAFKAEMKHLGGIRLKEYGMSGKIIIIPTVPFKEEE